MLLNNPLSPLAIPQLGGWKLCCYGNCYQKYYYSVKGATCSAYDRKVITYYSKWLPSYGINYRTHPGKDPEGGHGGQLTTPLVWKWLHASEKVSYLASTFSNISSYCSIKHSKLTSKVQKLVEIEHFTVKKQLIISRSRQLGGVVNLFVGVSKNFART